MGKEYIERNGRTYIRDGNQYAGSVATGGKDAPTASDLDTETVDTPDTLVDASHYDGLTSAYAQLVDNPDVRAAVEKLNEALTVSGSRTRVEARSSGLAFVETEQQTIVTGRYEAETRNDRDEIVACAAGDLIDSRGRLPYYEDIDAVLSFDDPEVFQRLSEDSANPIARKVALHSSNHPNPPSPLTHESGVHATDAWRSAINLGHELATDNHANLRHLLPGDVGYNFVMSDRGVFIQDADPRAGLRTVTLTKGETDTGREEWTVAYHQVEMDGNQRSFREPLGTTFEESDHSISAQEAAQIFARNVTSDYPYLDHRQRQDYTWMRDEDCSALETVCDSVEVNEFAVRY